MEYLISALFLGFIVWAFSVVCYLRQSIYDDFGAFLAFALPDSIATITVIMHTIIQLTVLGIVIKAIAVLVKMFIL